MNTAFKQDLVIRCLRDIRCIAGFSLPEWEILIRQARASDLLARIATRADESGLTNSIPEGPRQHLEAAKIYARAQSQEIRREIEYVREAMARAGVNPVILKGGGYVLADLPAARGRVFSDLDILVPKSALPEVESALKLHGWIGTHHNAYDQRYYRDWMHELPPLQHIRRETVLDVHHNILPETARLKPQAELLLAAAHPAANQPDLRVLSPPDMILHSMTHLFHNEELSHGLRDLSDIHLLLEHFGSNPDFWQLFLDRATRLDLRRPAYYGLTCVHKILGTRIPPEILEATRDWAPLGALRFIMDALWLRALRSRHSSADLPTTSAALFLLYVRAHWLRMPPHLLAYHLTVKALRRPQSDED